MWELLLSHVALKIRTPVILAGMGPVSSARIAAALLRAEIRKLKGMLHGDKAMRLHRGNHFRGDGVEWVGGSARKTNYDYTGGHLGELVELLCEERCRLFVSAVGVPPKWAVDRLHQAGCLVMNMEATATKIHKQGVVDAGPGDMIQSLHFSGRPCRMLNTPYVKEWNGPRAAERDALLAQGNVPLEVEMRNVARATRKGD
eukprot:gene27667-21107_t